MDVIDIVTYDFDQGDLETLQERTRIAFVNLFDPKNPEAILVANRLVALCHWADQGETSDPVYEAKMNSLRGVIFEIKKLLNIQRVELEGEINE